VRVNKVIEHMYSARPTLLTDTISHVKLSPGEGTQREGNGSALTWWQRWRFSAWRRARGNFDDTAEAADIRRSGRRRRQESPVSGQKPQRHGDTTTASATFSWRATSAPGSQQTPTRRRLPAKAPASSATRLRDRRRRRRRATGSRQVRQVY